MVNFQSMLVIIVFHGYFFVEIQTKWKVDSYDKVSLFMENKLQQMGLNKLATWLRSSRLKRQPLNDQIIYQDLYQMLKRYAYLYCGSTDYRWVKSGGVTYKSYPK